MESYQYVIAVHYDKSHLHCHIIFNNTNLYNGLSFTTEHNQGRRTERAWAELRQLSDEICTEHGISVISEPEKGHGVSHFEMDMQKEGNSWKDKLRRRIADRLAKVKAPQSSPSLRSGKQTAEKKKPSETLTERF